MKSDEGMGDTSLVTKLMINDVPWWLAPPLFLYYIAC
jgi:hypothetical protein